MWRVSDAVKSSPPSCSQRDSRISIEFYPSGECEMETFL